MTTITPLPREYQTRGLTSLVGFWRRIRLCTPVYRQRVVRPARFRGLGIRLAPLPPRHRGAVVEEELGDALVELWMGKKKVKFEGPGGGSGG